jgi:FkbM family methyltransferase
MADLMKKLWRLSPRGLAYLVAPQLASRFDARQNFEELSFPATIDDAELVRLRALPRYTPGTTTLSGKALRFIDADSYLSMVHEIFSKRNYLFKAKSDAPLIIDCGANIGLSLIYFKLLYPQSTIIAFEPDPGAFAALAENVKSFGFDHVELHNRAVWDRESRVTFQREGSWGGRIADDVQGNTIEVETIRLKEILAGRKIDFLKIDVEGAETDILLDCVSELSNIDHLFFEYHSFADRGQGLHLILAKIADAGFRYHIKEAALRDNPFVSPTTKGMDMQLDVFAYRAG